MLKRGYVMLFLALLASQSSKIHATDGSSGCGPSWYIFKENSIVSSFLRVVTNIALFPAVTLGMTFGTSNCTKHSLVEEKKRGEHLILVTFEKLRHDVARGEGEFLAAYGATFKCDSSAIPVFNKTLQANYEQIFASGLDASQIVESTKTVVGKHQDLASRCHA